MKSGKGKCGVIGIGWVVALLGSTAMGATTYNWTNTAGGRFDVSGNWNPAGPPVSADTAVFNQGSGTRTKITFPAGTTTTAGLNIWKWNAANQYEFAIADGGTAATYNAGATTLGGDWIYQADLLLSTGTLVSTSVSMGGADSVVKLVLDGPGTTWRVNNTWSGNLNTLDLDIQNGAKLEAQGAAGTSHILYTEYITDPARVQRIRVTGAGSSLIMTNKPAAVTVRGHARFEVLDGALASFSDFTLNADMPLITVVSNSTFQTRDFTIGAQAPAKTNDTLFIDSTVHSAGSVYIAGYYGQSLVKLENTEWTMDGPYLGLGETTGPDNTLLTIQNGSRMIATNAELRSQRNRPGTSILVTGTNSLLRCKSIYVSGSSGNLLPADNHGSVLTVSNGATVAASATCFVYANGVLRLSDGTFNNALTLGVVGKLEGSGTIAKGVETGNWPGGGTVRPGGSNGVGRLIIGNTFTQKYQASYADGRLELEISGTAPGTGYDVLSVTNAVTLAQGPVTISALPGFRAPAGLTTYDVVTGSSISTNGATITLPPNGDGTTWSVALVNIAGGRKALRVSSTFRPKGTELIIR